MPTIREKLQSININNGPNAIDDDVHQLLEKYLTDRAWNKTVSDRVIDQTIRENRIHSKHAADWMYGKKPISPCPCVNCYLERRELDK